MATGMCVVRHIHVRLLHYKISAVIVVSYMDRDVILGTWYLVLVAEYNCGTAFHCLYLYSYLPLSLSSLIFMKCNARN